MVRLWLAIAAVLIVGCGGLLPSTGWKVDVRNANRPLIISIATDRAAWMWLVPPGESLVLLRESEALQGSIELIDPDGCVLYAQADLLATSFTIVPTPLAEPPAGFSLNLTAEAPLDRAVDTENSTVACSG